MSRSGQILGDYQDRLVRKQQGYSDESDDDDELLELLDDDDSYDRYREQRIQELSDQFKTAKTNIQNGYGLLETLLSEEQVIQRTTKNKFTVIHFFHEGFTKCKIMDSKLEILSQKHLSTKFLRISVDNTPFLVTRLKIQVLPVVILYINGVESNRLIGFDKLRFDNDAEDFKIELLDKFLLDNGVIERKANSYQRISKAVKNDDNDSDDFDI